MKRRHEIRAGALAFAAIQAGATPTIHPAAAAAYMPGDVLVIREYIDGAYTGRTMEQVII